MLVPNRHGSSNSYRYGFQGQEKDDELKGEGNSLNYTFRMHDPRVGRFLSLDPLSSEFPWNSPYSFAENRVIDCIELEGAEQHYYWLKFNKNGEAELKYVGSTDNWFKSDFIKVYAEDYPGWSYTFTTAASGLTEDGKIQVQPGGGNGNSIESFELFAKDPIAAIQSGAFRTDGDMKAEMIVDIIKAVILKRALTSKVQKKSNTAKQANNSTEKNKGKNEKSLVGKDGKPKPIYDTYRGKTVKVDNSRINLRKGDGKSGTGVDYALKRHGINAVSGDNKSKFSLSDKSLMELLQSDKVVNSPVQKLVSGNYYRQVDTGQVVGNLPINKGGQQTTIITVITDVKGNLVNTFPGPLVY